MPINVIFIYIICIYTPILNTIAAFFKHPVHCKYQRKTLLSEVDPKNIGGEPISITQAPWQVSVRLIAYDSELYGSGHICGGSVITQRVVISAAHCVANTGVVPMVYRSPSEFTLVMGTVFLYDVTQYTLQYNVLQIAVNSGFNIATLVDDIALFFINGFIPQNYPTVAPIPLNFFAVPSGTMCTITGWGNTGSGYVSSVLMGATVPIIGDPVCSTNYGNISAGMLCAGYMTTGGEDACQGDSGGPLVCNGLLTGIISWGNGCAEPGFPGVYTNVSYFINWIIEANSTFNYSYYLAGKASGIFFGLNSFFVIIQSVLLTLFCKFILN